MSSVPQPVSDHPNLETPTKRTTKASLLLTLVSVLLVAAIGTSLFLLWRKVNHIEEAQKNLQFDQFISDYNGGTDFVRPTVNTIQFLRRGYSISFDSVEYTQNGLVLSGRIGNATQLWVSSLALGFSARPFPYKIKDKWIESKFPWWADDWNFGNAQTTVGDLNPGSAALFNVTIPNVKQTADEFQIAVSFSGERYQYLGR